jgi:flagellar protein FlaG
MDLSSITNLPLHTNTVADSPTPPVATTHERELIQAVRAVNAAELFGHDNELTFVMDRETHRAVVRIVNRDTREVIQQIPAEYVLRLAEEHRGR